MTAKSLWHRPGTAYSVVSDGRRIKGAVLCTDLVDFMKNALPCQSKDAVMERFGISAATWLKIKRGEPIRPSTASHLVRRLARDVACPLELGEGPP